MATYLADRVIVFSGVPSLNTTAHSPQSLLNGMNRFLELLGITFRRDPNNFRPRINKSQSVKVKYNFLKPFFFMFFSSKMNKNDFSNFSFLIKLFVFVLGLGAETSQSILLPGRINLCITFPVSTVNCYKQQLTKKRNIYLKSIKTSFYMHQWNVLQSTTLPYNRICKKEIEEKSVAFEYRLHFVIISAF